MFGGLYTEIKLSNLDIRFAKIGEQRVLTWQQFEELVNQHEMMIDLIKPFAERKEGEV